jgi:hypothetical protein
MPLRMSQTPETSLSHSKQSVTTNNPIINVDFEIVWHKDQIEDWVPIATRCNK